LLRLPDGQILTRNNSHGLIMDFGLPRTANPLTRPAPGWLTPTIRSVEIRIRSRYTIHPYLRRREIPRGIMRLPRADWAASRFRPSRS